MKKDEVPQDDENLLEGKTKVLCYATDDKGNYVQAHTTGWEPSNGALQQAWELVNEQIESAKKRVLAGEISPLAYHMEKNQMDIGLLAEHVGMWKWRVKKHLKPTSFSKLSHAKLERYAKAFNISVEELKKVE